MPDEDRIKEVLKALNDGNIQGDWIPALGLHTMLAITFNAYGGQDVDPNHGVTVKAFYNQKTGEIKTYVADLLRKK